MPAPEGDPEWRDPQLTSLLDHLNSHLSRHAYLAGDVVTLADVSILAMTIDFRRLGFPASDYPNFTAWYERMHARAAWRSVNVAPWVT